MVKSIEPTPSRDADPVVAELRRRLRAADEAIVVPSGLWDSVREPRGVPAPARRRWFPAAAAGAVLAVAAAAFAAGALWQLHREASAPLSGRATAVPGSISSSLVRTSSVQPDPGASCGPGTSTDANITTCISVEGSGPEINSALASVRVAAARTVQVCLSGPDGTIGCGPFQSVAPGYTLLLSWSPQSTEPAGQYCANTVRLNANGSHAEIGSYCVAVHG